MRSKSKNATSTSNILILLFLFLSFIVTGYGSIFLRGKLEEARAEKEKLFITAQSLLINIPSHIQLILQGQVDEYALLLKYQKEMASIKGEFAGTALENEWRDFSNKAAALTQGLKKENVWNILSRKAELENKFNQIKSISDGQVDAEGNKTADGLLDLSFSADLPDQFMRLALSASYMPDNLSLLFSGNKSAVVKFEEEFRKFKIDMSTASNMVQEGADGSTEVASIIGLGNNFGVLDEGLSALIALYDQNMRLQESGEKLIHALEKAFEQGKINEVSSLTTIFGDVTPAIVEILLGVSLFILALGLFIVFRMGRAGAKIDQQVLDQNARNEESILALLDVMTDLASGDLRVQAKVTDDITGTIADSFNYTIEELRGLVGTVKSSSTKVTEALVNTSAVADKLAEASYSQAAQITDANSVVARMNQAMIDVSSQTAASVEIAMNSTEVARSGAERVRMTISGMDQIREHIQETSKRIKRLGESSQEIGDIVELIHDIADQTHLLALNAAIQASTAGEAGRGFAVVADEVQRLAERTGNATKRVEGLVKTIQADMNEAIAAMEKSTSEVVNGATLAERAGESLNEIESVSVRLATLIKNVSFASREVSDLGERVRESMDSIRSLTEQNVESTAVTTRSVEELNELASELRQSVSGFIVPN